MHHKKYIEILQIMETQICQKYIYNLVWHRFLLDRLIFRPAVISPIYSYLR